MVQIYHIFSFILIFLQYFLFLMKLILYIVSIITILLILVNNPKATNLNVFTSQSRILNSTRSMQRGLQTTITINIMIFFILIILLVLN